MMRTPQMSVESGRVLETTDISHLKLWQDSVARRPNATALISRHQKPADFRWVGSQSTDQDYLSWTYADLDRGARRLATALNRLTHIERRPIATLVNTQAEWALFYWAAAYLHSPLVPINPKIATRTEEITHMLALTRPAVLVAADSIIASQLEQSLPGRALSAIPVKILLTDQCDGHTQPWNFLSNVMVGDPSPPDTPRVIDSKDTTLVLFTSGTTSLPKPCHVSSFACVNAALGCMESREINSNHIFVQHLPNFHSYGVGWSLGLWIVGGTVILPSAAFEAQASLECFGLFKATHTSLVPTTAQAILAHPYLAQADLRTLISVDIAGAGVLPSVVHACTKALHAPAFTSYGMTESPGTVAWPLDAGSVVRNGEVLAGWPVRGTTVKICEPGTTTIVPRGEVGELHNGGPHVIHGYADPNVSSDSFYVDEQGTQWIVTGDQAVMEQDGAIRISGRYKDMIIRGGENISPASIEDYLRRQNGVLAAEVVGVNDEMAGEVPIAVITVKAGETVDVNALKQATSRDLGPAFGPKMVLRLDTDMHKYSWPTTASGKIRKVELRVWVNEWLKKQQESDAFAGQDEPVIDTLLRIWKTISGTDGLLPTSVIQSFADSLMMMQLSGLVKKKLRRDITVEDFKLGETIQDQADLIESRPLLSSAKKQQSRRQTPPSIDDVFHTKGDSGIFESTKSTVSALLAKSGLAWEDVEDVVLMPNWDAIFCHRSRPTSWNLRFTYHAAVSSEVLEKALKKSLEYHPTLRAMACEDGSGQSLLAPIRCTEKWFDTFITTGWEVDTPGDLNKLLLNHPELDCATLPGPLMRMHIARVRSDGSSGFVLVGSHAVSDMSMTKLWLDDIAMLLAGEGTPTPHVLFKDYAKAYFQHQEGVEAERGVQHWTGKHQGIFMSESSFWPPQRAPEFFKGTDAGWSRWNGAKARHGERSVADTEKLRAQKGVRRMVVVQDIAALKAQHGVPVFMLVKAAIALMNISKTGGKEAIFGTVNAARTWPFNSDYTTEQREAFAGNPLDISGCTTEYVLDRIPVGRSKSVVAFMQQVNKDEEQNSGFAHTPLNRVIDRLRDPLSADDTRTWAERDRDAEAILSSIRRQSFNWLPTAPNAQAQASPTGLRMLEMLSRMDNGLTITGFLADDKKSVALSFSWDAEHLGFAEAQRTLDLLADLVEKMGRLENWDMTVGDLLRC